MWGFNRYFLKIADLPPNILSEIKWKSRSKSKSVQSQKLKKWFISLELLSKSHILSKARYLHHSKSFLLYFWKKKPEIQEKYISDFASKNNLRNFFLFTILRLTYFLSFDQFRSKKIKTNSNLGGKSAKKISNGIVLISHFTISSWGAKKFMLRG